MNRKLCFVGGRDTWKIISTERSLAGGKQYKTNTPVGQWSVLSVLSVCSRLAVLSFRVSHPVWYKLSKITTPVSSIYKEGLSTFHFLA